MNRTADSAATLASETIIDTKALIDVGPVGSLQLSVVILCGLVVALEGFDAQAIGYVAPSLTAAWHLHPGDLGPAISAGLLALMGGALFIAPLADRIGRRPILLASTIVFGLGTLATAWTSNLTTLTMTRVITGIGIGGAMPNALALTAEFMPARRRSFLIVMMFNGFNIGSMTGGILAAQFLNSQGWKPVFWYGGLCPLLLAPMLLLLPESLSFLTSRNTEPDRRRALAVLQRLRPSVRWNPLVRLSAREIAAVGSGPRALFAPGLRVNTAVLWLLFFFGLLDVYLLVSWIPTAMRVSGATPSVAIIAGIVLQAGAILASLTVGWSLDRFGPAGLAPAYVLGAICIAAIGHYAADIPIALIGAFGAGFGVVGSQAGLNAVATVSYPTALRATGVGWAVGIGRVGSIVGPVAGGALLNAHVPIESIFYMTAGPALILALASIAYARIHGRQLADSSDVS